jgi:hypothetical protein
MSSKVRSQSFGYMATHLKKDRPQYSFCSQTNISVEKWAYLQYNVLPTDPTYGSRQEHHCYCAHPRNIPDRWTNYCKYLWNTIWSIYIERFPQYPMAVYKRVERQTCFILQLHKLWCEIFFLPINILTYSRNVSSTARRSDLRVIFVPFQPALECIDIQQHCSPISNVRSLCSAAVESLQAQWSQCVQFCKTAAKRQKMKGNFKVHENRRRKQDATRRL